MKENLIWFGIGSAWPIIVGVIALLIGNKFRHICKVEDCGSFKTTTHYRMFHLHHIPTTKNGFDMYAVFKLRKCEKCFHVVPSMKQKMFTHDQIRSKPREQLIWSDPFTKGLLKAAEIGNPHEDYNLKQFNSPEPTPRIIKASPAILDDSEKRKHYRHHFHYHHS